MTTALQPYLDDSEDNEEAEILSVGMAKREVTKQEKTWTP